MEGQIKRAVAKLKTNFALFWGVALVLVLSGEFELLPVGLLADDFRGAYMAETIGILLTAICVPVALKLFSWVLNKRIDNVSLQHAIPLYTFWSMCRMWILGVALVANILIYYLVLSNTGLLCALVILTASLFCVPGEKQLRRDLHISQDEPESNH